MEKKAMVNISVSTLNALKKMLFCKEEGVDLSNIIKDIACARSENEDLTAINVGLTYMGIKPEIDKETRFGSANTYWRQYCRFDFVEYSLIMNKVVYEQTEFTREKDKDEWKERKLGKASCSYEEWLEYEKTNEVAIKSISEKCPITQNSTIGEGV